MSAYNRLDLLVFLYIEDIIVMFSCYYMSSCKEEKEYAS